MLGAWCSVIDCVGDATTDPGKGVNVMLLLLPVAANNNELTTTAGSCCCHGFKHMPVLSDVELLPFILVLVGFHAQWFLIGCDG